MTASTIRASFAQSEEATGWPGPDITILSGGRGRPATMPGDMFGDLWPLIGHLAAGAGAPVDYVALGVLAVSASLIGNKRRSQPFREAIDWKEPGVLWAALVGDPSANKSPALDAATSPLRSMEIDHADEHRNRMSIFEAQAERARAERDKWKGLVKAAANDGSATPELPKAAEAPDTPERVRLIVQDATPEALGGILAGNPNGTLGLRDELSGWLSSFERYATGGREFWLEAFGGRRFTIDRKNNGGKPVTLPFCGVSVLGGIQPAKLSACLLDLPDDGLVARFLWAWPDPVPYTRPRIVPDRSRLERAYRRLSALEPRWENDQTLPVVMLLDEDAATIFEEWKRENDECIREAHGFYQGFCGKASGIALRLALVAELLWWADGNGAEPTTISAKALAAAVFYLENYAKPTAVRVFGDAALPACERDAAALARYIQKTGARTINVRDIQRSSGIPTLKLATSVDEAVKVLVEADWLKPAPGRDGGTTGRARKDYLVNPAVHRG